MSHHVYVSRPGFKKEPIPKAEWLAIAKGNARLSVKERKSRRGTELHEVSLLKSKERLSLSPYGLVHTQNPSEELVEVLFEIASKLDASVYSERLKRYESVADWRKRTQTYRDAREVRVQKSGRDRRLRMLLWAVLISLSALAGWYLAPHSAA